MLFRALTFILLIVGMLFSCNAEEAYVSIGKFVVVPVEYTPKVEHGTFSEILRNTDWGGVCREIKDFYDKQQNASSESTKVRSHGNGGKSDLIKRVFSWLAIIVLGFIAVCIPLCVVCGIVIFAIYVFRFLARGIFGLFCRLWKAGRSGQLADHAGRMYRNLFNTPVWIGCDVSEFLTEQEKVVARDVEIDRLMVTGAVLQGGWLQDRSLARVERMTRSRNGMSFQLQTKCFHCDRQMLIGVHVILRQDGTNILARADWAAYASAGCKYGYNLAKVSKRAIPNTEACGKVPVADSADTDGFGVAELHLQVRSLKPIFTNGLSASSDMCIKVSDGESFLCAQDEGQQEARPIREDSDSAGSCRKFIIVGNSDGTISIKSKANEKYVSAEIDNGGRLVARADTIQAWEKFWLTRRLDGRCMLRSCANRKYVCKSADVGYVAAVADRAVESGLFIIDRA